MPEHSRATGDKSHVPLRVHHSGRWWTGAVGGGGDRESGDGRAAVTGRRAKATAASPLPDVIETPEGAPDVEATGAITDTVPSLVLVANTVFLTSSTATPNEPLPTVTVWVTVLVCSKHTDRCPGVLDSPGG